MTGKTYYTNNKQNDNGIYNNSLKALTVILIFFIFVISCIIITGKKSFAESNISYNQKGNFELGGSFGTPSGLNARYWFTNKYGLDVNAGVSLDKQPVFTFDFLVEDYKLYRSSTWESRFFYGVGALFSKEDDEFKNNLRVPLGLSFPMLQYPITFSFYVAPALVLNPKSEFEMNWGIGVRYNFSRASEIRENQYRLEREVGKLERDVESLKHGLDTTKGKLSETEGMLSSTKGKLAEKEGELSATKGKVDELSQRLGDLKVKLDKTATELDTAKTKLSSTTVELASTKNQLDEVKTELNNTKKNLNEKQTELAKKQTELNNAKVIIENAYTGKKKQEEEEKIALRQKELNEQVVQLDSQKKSWEKIKTKEAQKREDLKKKCAERGGVIDEFGYCTCPENQEWDPRTDKCVCVKGYQRNLPTEKCKPCETIKESGACADGNCEDYEAKVQLKTGAHKYICVKKCRKNNEAWSKRKNDCVCRDGYYRDDKGECVKRQ
ncbi:MAG: hypothetical protein V1874_03900 [Spirochaetota bacterium]